jgi:hypothetical protein
VQIVKNNYSIPQRIALYLSFTNVHFKLLTVITDTLTDLHNRGFTSDFILLGDRLLCTQTQCFFSSNEFDIIEVHSFEDDYSDKHQTVVYAIECLANTIKGILFQNPNPFNKQNIVLTKLRKFWK